MLIQKSSLKDGSNEKINKIKVIIQDISFHFSQLQEMEQRKLKITFNGLKVVERRDSAANVTRLYGSVNQNTSFFKSILDEHAVKKGGGGTDKPAITN